MGEIRGVPVVMYHGVGPDKKGFPWNHLITPLHVFEDQMRLLAEEGWHTITLRQLYDHMAVNAPLPSKPVVLTFDDGYLDNWVYAYPVLKKYGHHAVVWMSTDFANPEDIVHPTLEDVWNGRLSPEELENRGYLSWAEMREMVKDETMEIQSHARTHTWYFSSPRIVDFHRPAGVDGYVTPIWLIWNHFPERKYRSMEEDLSDDIPYGTPIYEHAKSLSTRRYFEDKKLKDTLVRYVEASGGREFFKSPDWRGRLLRIVEEFGERDDRFETDDEYEERVRDELTESRRIIEEKLSRPVEFLCWPGGGRNETVKRIAREVGYLATTTHFEDRTRKNTFGQNPSEINRIGSGSPWNWRGRLIKNTGGRFFVCGLESFAGFRGARWRLRVLKAGYIILNIVLNRS